MEVPTFRYMADADRFLKELGKEVDETSQLMKKAQKALASNLAAVRVKASESIIDISGNDPAEQRRLLRSLKHKVDPELTKIVVPNQKKLESQYNVAEDLYEKLKGLEQAETQVQMTFSSRRGAEYDALMHQFKVLKEKVQKNLSECLQFLNDIANKHVPESFQKYIDMVADTLSEHVIFRESNTFMYVSVDKEGNLVFTAYIMLQDVANDEGAVAPHLYISIQWIVGGEVSVDLNHEYEVPNKLLGQGEVVATVGEAVKAISTMLELENFAGTLGVVPLALQLNVDPTSLHVNQFSYADVINKLRVDDNTIEFTFRKELTEPKAIAEISAAIYQELKKMMKKTGARLSMTPSPKGKTPASVKFNIVTPAEGGSLSTFDLEWMRDKFSLNQTQLNKIAQIINRA